MEFWSYEGTLAVPGGTPVGMTSPGIGAPESGSERNQSLQHTGAGTRASDFAWVPPACHTRGAVNRGQTFGNATRLAGPERVAACLETPACPNPHATARRSPWSLPRPAGRGVRGARAPGGDGGRRRGVAGLPVGAARRVGAAAGSLRHPRDGGAVGEGGRLTVVRYSPRRLLPRLPSIADATPPGSDSDGDGVGSSTAGESLHPSLVRGAPSAAVRSRACSASGARPTPVFVAVTPLGSGRGPVIRLAQLWGPGHVAASRRGLRLAVSRARRALWWKRAGPFLSVARGLQGTRQRGAGSLCRKGRRS